jgi:hypothetical protein
MGQSSVLGSGVQGRGFEGVDRERGRVAVARGLHGLQLHETWVGVRKIGF